MQAVGRGQKGQLVLEELQGVAEQREQQGQMARRARRGQRWDQKEPRREQERLGRQRALRECPRGHAPES